MGMIRRNAGLTLAAILALLTAFALHQGGSGAVPPPAPPPVIAPPQPSAPVVKVKKTDRRVRTARATLPPAPAAKVRGARLKEKGEALGGTTPDRVDTGTMTVPAAQ